MYTDSVLSFGIGMISLVSAMVDALDKWDPEAKPKDSPQLDDPDVITTTYEEIAE